MRWILILMVLAVPRVASAQQFANQIEIINEFANSICGVIERSGFQQVDTSESEKSREIKTILAATKADAKTAKEVERYTNVLQEHLPEELNNLRECRLKVWNDLHVILLKDGSARIEVTQHAILETVKSQVPSGPGSTGTDVKAGLNARSFDPRLAEQTSFDCFKASTTPERVLCTYKPAGKADIVLNFAYRVIRSRLGAAEKKVLRRSQLNWIDFRDDVCVGDAEYEWLSTETFQQLGACLERETENRTIQLISYQP